MRQVMFRVYITGKDGVAKRCNLGGDYQLVVKDSSLCLCGVKLHQVIYEWPYPDIRCYGYTDKAFNFVAGRASTSGEGMISVKTGDGFAINEAVNEKVQLMKKNMDLQSRGENPTPPADGSGDDRPEYTDPYSVETQSTDEAGMYVNQ
ncbi:docking protein 3-like [Haliotis rubra]|uniref:docking protein 3-like n=1 Tax=Haliotis rubra TaxID=36100 RepID=UPI001EE6098E|nr:docking protein 3-like [Haliotis rubra]